HPILDDGWPAPQLGPAPCGFNSQPFVDETTSPDRAAQCAGPGAVPAWCGTMVGSGPIENLQIRYIVDDGISDDPQQFHIWGDTSGQRGTGYHMGTCDMLPFGVPVQKVLREVRISVVARSLMPDHATNGTTHVKRYGLATWEGV